MESTIKYIPFFLGVENVHPNPAVLDLFTGPIWSFDSLSQDFSETLRSKSRRVGSPGRTHGHRLPGLMVTVTNGKFCLHSNRDHVDHAAGDEEAGRDGLVSVVSVWETWERWFPDPR